MDKHPLRAFLQDPLQLHFGKQLALAEALGIKEPVLSDYLNSKRSISEDLAVRLSEKLKTPLNQTIIACEAARCEYQAKEARSKDEADAARRYEMARDSLLETLEIVRQGTQTPIVPAIRRSTTTLEDFPHLRPGPWCVITGDRREIPPASRADLAALSVSCSDLMFLLSLGLPPETLVRSDKIFRILSENDIKELLTCNILAIGSPAVSLATREIMRRVGATHLFNITQDEYDKEQALLDSINEVARLDTDALTSFSRRDDVAEAISQFLPDFRKAGFVDPIDFRGIRGRSQPRGQDHGVVALAPNPWSDEHIVVVTAGVHGPGSAGALQMLSRPKEFVERPWGGVVLVNTPPLAPWQHLFERYLHPRFETHPYDAKQYIDHLQRMIDGIKSPAFREMKISEATLKKILAFAQRLAKTPKEGQ